MYFLVIFVCFRGLRREGAGLPNSICAAVSGPGRGSWRRCNWQWQWQWHRPAAGSEKQLATAASRATQNSRRPAVTVLASDDS